MGEINYTGHRRAGYADQSPYPEIKVARPNKYYAELLMDDYAGIVSEFTAINQYLYHHFFFKDISRELGELLENISITEMLHMEMLADTIKLLGGNPVIRGSFSTCKNYWYGQFVEYGKALYDQLKADLESEYKAIRNYRDHINIIDDPDIKSMLERIILDEKVHIKLFKEALKKYCNVNY